MGLVKDSPLLVSIIIPTLNEAENIGGLLQFLREISQREAYEVIISDGGSQDATLQIANRFPTVKWLSGPAGRARQLNRGAQVATGKWLYFLHADTWPPLSLWQQIRAADQAGLDSACFSLRFDDQHPLLRFCSWCSRINWNCFRYGDQSLLVKRNAFNAIGGYREELEIMEGNELVRRLSRRSSFRLLPAEVQTSARKYRYYGPIYLQSVYSLIYLLDRLGLGQSRLISIYRYWLPPMQQPIAVDV